MPLASKRTCLPLLAAFACVSALFLFFSLLSPLVSDNFIFSRDIKPGYASFYRGDHIAAFLPNLASTFRQSVEMYNTWCGRFFGNLIVYLLFLLPAALRSIITACGFSIYIWLLALCIFGRQWRNRLTPGWIFALAGLLWAGIPSFGEAFFWISVGGEAALIGQAAILIPFRFAFEDTPEKNCSLVTLKFLGLIVAGAVVATLDYATSAALPATCIAACLWLYFRKPRPTRKLPLLPLGATIGICAGAFLTLTAPGNACRMALSTDPAVHEYMAAGWFERIAGWLSHLPEAALMQIAPLLFLLWGCFWLWKQHKGRWFANFPPAGLLFLLPAVLTHAAYLFTAWPPARALATTSAQLIVCACIVWTAANKNPAAAMERQFRLLRALLCIFCALTLPYEAINFYQLHGFIKEREQILLTAREEASIPPLAPGTGDRYWVLGKYQPDVSDDPTFWVNRAMAAHYGLAKVSRIPTSKTAAYYRWGNQPAGIGDAQVHLGADRLALELGVSAHDAKTVHIYFYGANSLLNIFPHSLGQKIFQWLGASPNRLWLVPVLLARTDFNLKPAPSGKSLGRSMILKIVDPEYIWLVRPGAGKYSLDLLPMVLSPA